jgi:RHS repeat-associated protein
MERDALGRATRETDAIGRARTWEYDASGNLIAACDRDGRYSTRTTTSWNLVGEQRDALGNAMTYDYSRLEQIVGVTDPNGNVSRFDFDLKERLVRVHRNGRLRDEYVYDAGDHLIEKRNGDGDTLFANEPHDNHLVGTRRLASGGKHRFDYDPRGRITEASTDEHEVRLGYDYGPLPASDVRDGTGVLHRLEDDAWHTRVLGRFLALQKWSDGELALVDPAGRRTSVHHDDAGSVRRYCSNGTIEVLQYDEEGRLLARFAHRQDELGRTKAHCTVYTYTPEGDLVRVADTDRGTTVYEVDAAHRLTAEITPGNERYEFLQDPANNVTSKPGLLGLHVGPGNRAEVSSIEAFEHDERDRLALRTARDGTTTLYEYDSFDMLRSATRRAPDGANDFSWSATYDALGRRVSCGTAASRKEFYWDGDRLAAEVAPSGRLRVYQYASRGALTPLGFTEYESREADPGSGASFHVFSNPVGMPLYIEDERGEIVWWADRIDPYGAIDVRPGATVEYNLRWPGHYYDPDTGLHYNRYRYYDPALGRYLQSDPIGYRGSPVNLYAYCANPLVDVDALGLEHRGRTTRNSGDEGSSDNDGVDRPPRTQDEPQGQTLTELLKDHPDLLAELREKHRTTPEWQGIDPDTTPVFLRPKADVDVIRAKPGESGGHHPHGLALGGPEGQTLTPTNETRTQKNPNHSAATGLQRRTINAIKKGQNP